MSEPRFPGDPLTRTERTAVIQANLRQPQVHHPTCICCRAQRTRACPVCMGGNPDCAKCGGSGTVE